MTENTGNSLSVEESNDVTSSSNSDVKSLATLRSDEVTPMTPEILKSLGFKKKRDGEYYWFEKKVKRWTFITNDNSYSDKNWHIGFNHSDYGTDTIFLKHCDNVEVFTILFLALTNKELSPERSVATTTAQSGTADNQNNQNKAQ